MDLWAKNTEYFDFVEDGDFVVAEEWDEQNRYLWNNVRKEQI